MTAVQQPDRTSHTGEVGGRGDEVPSLLERVRSRFGVLLLLMLLVEVVEWFDAVTPLFPERSVAALGLGLALAWSLMLRRLGRSTLALEFAPVMAIMLVGWGLGRSGATLALLLGCALLRALYGSRRSVLLATGGFLVAYTVLGAFDRGVAGTFTDLNLLTVSIGLVSIAWVIRQIAEVMASHDVVATWDHVLSVGGHDLLAVTDHRDVRPTIQRTLAELRQRTPSVTGGLLPPPPVPDVRTDAPVAPDPLLPAELGDRLDRLRTNARLVSNLLESEARYRELAEHNQDGIYLRAMGVPTHFDYANEATRALLREVAASDDPARFVELLHPEDHSVIAAALGDAAYLTTSVTVRLLDTAQPDGHRWIEVVEAPSTVRNGEVITVQGRVRDVSVALRQEQALAQALQQEQQAAAGLRQVDELRTTFLAAVSHELRTPLAGLLGASQTLVAHQERLSDEQSGQLLETVHRQASRLRVLLDDLLDVERLSRGLLEPARVDTALVPLVYRVVGTFDGDTSRVTVDGDDAVMLDVDPAQVERIVDNLVRNALKHTSGGVPIRVLVEPHEHGVLLVVEDDGPGVPASLRDGLFAPFVQGPQSRSHPSPGTGIGLSLVSKFAELHGGRAWLEESSTGGARFVVLLAGGRAPSSTVAQSEPSAG